MTQSYTINGMTCDGCVATVKGKLLGNPDITAAEVYLDGKATITMQRHLGVTSLQETLGKDSRYRITEAGSGHGQHKVTAAETKSWIVTYRPLLLIGAYITAVSFLTSRGSLHVGMNSFMAGFFLVFSFFKLLDLKGFASSYAMYDLLAMKLPFYGFVYPFIEMGLGLAYTTGFVPRATYWVTLIVMGFSSLGVIQSLWNKQKIRCACLGDIFNLPMSTVTLFEDLLMVAMAFYMVTGF